MKKEGSLKTILAILIIVLLCLISFGGIYVKDKNIMKNVLPDYVLGMDLGSTKIIKLDAEGSSDETVVTDDAGEEAEAEEENAENTQTETVNTTENYKKSKKIIEQRIKLAGIEQYTIRLDEGTGSIVIEVPSTVDENNLEEIWAEGKTEITLIKTENSNSSESQSEETAEDETAEIDEENKAEEENQTTEVREVIADNNSIKSAKAYIDETYESYGLGSVAKLEITFKNDAVKKFKELKNNYVATTSEDGNSIEININGTTIDFTETEFLEQAVNGTINLYVGKNTTDKEQLQQYLEEATSKKILVQTEKLPVTYSIKEIKNNRISSNVSKLGVVSVFTVILAVMLIYLAIKYKSKGVFAWLSILGFGAALTLVLRFAKVQISIASIVSIAAMLFMQFIYLIKVLNNLKISSRVFNEKTIEYTKMIIPVFILGIVAAVMPALDNVKFIYGNTLEIANFGMVIFWGVILFEIFNNIITRAILTDAKNK